MNSTNWSDVLLVATFIGVVIALMKFMARESPQAIKKIFDTLPDFKVDAFYIGGSKSTSVAIDNGRKKICFIRMTKPVIYDFTQVLKCELIIDAYWQVKSRKQGFSGTARVGGERVKLNGSMDVPGDKTKVYDGLGLKITMNDAAKLEYRLMFIEMSTQEDSDSYQKNYEVFTTWRKFFELYMIEKDEITSITHTDTTINITADASATPQVAQLVSSILAQTQTPSIADEILKLKNLLDQGALTQEEFEEQKAKVLNG